MITFFREPRGVHHWPSRTLKVSIKGGAGSGHHHSRISRLSVLKCFFSLKVRGSVPLHSSSLYLLPHIFALPFSSLAATLEPFLIYQFPLLPSYFLCSFISSTTVSRPTYHNRHHQCQTWIYLCLFLALVTDFCIFLFICLSACRQKWHVLRFWKI